ncbi:hypothetical protein P171DRAFT_489110 [Karstenula rhodostoma CBS 690.94]|uniref:Uncharacterized protein n=1 Tax=Karstenula rhodostoma CBS 690.94 TaxID=1392251 RepID=A0A9P4P8I7_9PLEO|nr:hypothetical protein P171DRAFT_489110 [Karstenula rhodostoma CBS 690.94]
MSFNIQDLLSEATGVKPVKFKTTFPDSKMTYPSAEELAAHPQPQPQPMPKPKPTVPKPVAQKQALLKSTSQTPAAAKNLYEELARVFPDEPKKPTAKPKSALEKLFYQDTPAAKRRKAPRASSKEVSKASNAAGAGAHNACKQPTEDFDAGAGSASKKRSYEEFEITSDTDLAELAKKSVLKPAKMEAEAVKAPAAKKVKSLLGKAGVRRVASKKSSAEAEYSDEEVEYAPCKKATKKPVSRTASKTMAADVKVEKRAAAVESPAPKKPAMNKNLAKVLDKAKGGNLPGKRVMLTAAQMAARKAGRK